MYLYLIISSLLLLLVESTNCAQLHHDARSGYDAGGQQRLMASSVFVLDEIVDIVWLHCKHIRQLLFFFSCISDRVAAQDAFAASSGRYMCHFNKELLLPPVTASYSDLCFYVCAHQTIQFPLDPLVVISLNRKD